MKKFKSEYANELRENVLKLAGYDDIDLLKYISEIKEQNIFLMTPATSNCLAKIREMYEKKKAVAEDKEIMHERTLIQLNGHTFKIKPITLGEEIDFQVDFKYSLIPNVEEGVEPTDTDIINLMHDFFIDRVKLSELKESALKKAIRKPIRVLLKEKFSKKRYDCEYYKNTLIYGLVKWMEKKIYIDNKNIRFYDLERKYGLNKLEIYQLMCKLLEISNFPQHLPI